MNTAKKIIIYDDSCPLCSAYTNAFVKAGFLTQHERRSFSTIDALILEKIDRHKCRNEIPLIDTSTDSVKYGIDVLLDILDNKIPLIKFIGTLIPVNWFLKKLYNLISYNRRVITAGKLYPGNFNCTPDFNFKYRILLLFLGFCFNTIMLIPEFNSVFANSVFSNTTIPKLQVAHFIFVLINFLLAVNISGRKSIEFLGQANMIALIYTLLLVPLCLINKALAVPSFINNMCLIFVFSFMVTEYKRRMKYADMMHYQHIVIIDAVAAILFISYLIVG